MLPGPSLYVLIDSVDFVTDPAAPRLHQLLDDLIAAGVQLIQLRDKRLDDRQLLHVAEIVADRCRQTPTTSFIVNDRVDIAILAEADGVHLGQEDLPIADARRMLSPGKLIGISTHSLDQAAEAEQGGADYIAIGPMFPSSTKHFQQFVGLELPQQVIARCSCPVFAIGGIDASKVAQVKSIGINRIAVSSAVTKSPNPQQSAAELLTLLRNS